MLPSLFATFAESVSSLQAVFETQCPFDPFESYEIAEHSEFGDVVFVVTGFRDVFVDG